MNVTKGKRERVGRILLMHANHREDVEEVRTGEIAAAIGLKFTVTGDTLSDDRAQIILESMEFPEPVIRIAIEPKTKAGQERMSMAFTKLAEEDPTFKTWVDEESGKPSSRVWASFTWNYSRQTSQRIQGRGECGKPQVSYKETITKEATVTTRYARQSGGRGQFAQVKLVVEPNEGARAMSSRTRLRAAPSPRIHSQRRRGIEAP